jgi:hypothetical protein
MRVAVPAVPIDRRPGGVDDVVPRGSGAGRPRRRPVRPLDDGTTESVHIIEFLLPAGERVQPVIFLDRQLLE